MDNIPINTNLYNDFEENVLNMFGQTSNVSNRAQNRYLDTLYDTVSHYNQNMRQYNSNMQNIISILQHMQYSQTRSSWNNSSPVYTGRTPAAGGGGATRSDGGGTTRAAGGGTTRAGPRAPLRTGGTTRATGGGTTRNRSGTTRNGSGTGIPSSSGFPISNSLQRPINRPGFNNYSLNDIASDNSLLFTYMFQPESGVNPNAPLSADEISRYTSTYSCTPTVFGDISGNRCPISLDNFQIGDVLIRINGCGHTFKRHALMRWFERSNSCPMCRHNLRESHVDASNNNVDASNNNVDASNNNVDISNNNVDISNNSIDFNTINQTFNSMIQTWVNEFQTNIEHPQPVYQPEPVSHPQPEPVSQPQPEPVSQPQPEPVSQSQPETDSEDDIEPDLSVD